MSAHGRAQADHGPGWQSLPDATLQARSKLIDGHLSPQSRVMPCVPQCTLLEGALRHAGHDPALRTEMSVDELRTSLQGGVWQRLPPRSMVSLCSTVRRHGGTSAHLPMLDLGLPATDPHSEAASIDALEALGLTGALFTSGRSFHFVADALVTIDEMVPLP